MKAKHIKKIKSRTFHRLLKKDKLKAEASQIQMDPEAAKEYAMKQLKNTNTKIIPCHIA